MSITYNDGVDTIHKNNEMLVILKNVMNDLYARDTSSKIRAVKQSTFKSGKYVGCYAPIGYRKSPADKHILEIDPVTAPVVLRIFDMRLQGDSFRKIARTLNEDLIEHRPVEGRTRNAIVTVGGVEVPALLLHIAAEHDFLIFDGYGFSGSLIVMTGSPVRLSTGLCSTR